MARPTKTGMDYFPLDTQLSDDVFAVECAFGNDGFTVLVKAWQALYQTETGELDCSGIIRRITLAKRANISEERWVEIIETCISLGLFDREAWETGSVLTSRGVKKRISKVLQEREQGRQRVEKRKDRGYTPHNSTENPTDHSTVNPTSEREKEKRKTSLPNGFLLSPFRDEAFAFADWFTTELKPESIKVTEKIRNDWALVWYQLRETDGRNTGADKSAMKHAIEWARREPFWSKNFLTPMKLRKKNSEGVMFIDCFIELSRQNANGSAANTRQNGSDSRGYNPPSEPLKMGES